ncbi:hypothetical protein CMV_000600 [Castanea mollissima]|uniref:Uncharacterized protein n=1 Tax=Castanea mollissima TaxID=60419 RepID=A0A8J4RM46_9ROSI|nr:hypothetical protein CMV_000600 [Castanea mollissima]
MAPLQEMYSTPAEIPPLPLGFSMRHLCSPPLESDSRRLDYLGCLSITKLICLSKQNHTRTRQPQPHTHNLESAALLLIQSNSAALQLFPYDSAALLFCHSKSAEPTTIFSLI